MSLITSVNNLTIGNDVLDVQVKNADQKQLCGGNKAVYRIIQTQPSGISTFQNFIPLKANYSYNITAKWSAYSSNTGIINAVIYFSVNTTIPYFPSAVVASTGYLTQSTLGNSLSMAVDAINNGLNVTSTTTLGGTVTQTIEFEVFANKAF